MLLIREGGFKTKIGIEPRGDRSLVSLLRSARGAGGGLKKGGKGGERKRDRTPLGKP